MGYSMPKSSLEKSSRDTIEPKAGECVRGFKSFQKVLVKK